MQLLRNYAPAIRAQMPLIVFVFLLLAIGALFGLFLVMSLSIEQHQALSRYLGSFLQLAIQGKQSDLQIAYLDAFFVHFKWIFLIWVLGISVIGIPFIAVLNFLKGSLLGFTVGYLTTQYSWKGFFLACIALLPTHLLLIPALLISSVVSISFALFLVKKRFNQGNLSTMRLFWTSMFIISIMVVAVAFATCIEVYFVPHILRWFAPYIV
jgi:stage II sporulation protein M